MVVVASVRVYRDNIMHALEVADDVELVGGEASAAQALRVIEASKPDVALIDVSGNGCASEIDAIARLEDGPSVLVMGMFGEERDVISYAEAGVAGYMTPATSAAELVDATRAAAPGDAVCPPGIGATLLKHLREVGTCKGAVRIRLTSRETEILALVNRGLTNKEIGRLLVIEVATVKNHIHNLLQKLQLNERAEAAAWLRSQAELEADLSPSLSGANQIGSLQSKLSTRETEGRGRLV